MTAGAIDAAADNLERAAREIRNQARMMRDDGDLTRAAEVVSIVAQMPAQCRLDLLVTRPMRALGVK